jgi:hypothetical protein
MQGHPPFVSLREVHHKRVSQFGGAMKRKILTIRLARNDEKKHPLPL